MFVILLCNNRDHFYYMVYCYICHIFIDKTYLGDNLGAIQTGGGSGLETEFKKWDDDKFERYDINTDNMTIPILLLDLWYCLTCIQRKRNPTSR